MVRAELPGFDPDKDIQVFVENGHLVLKAQRSQEEHGNGHSEFRYGSFARTLALLVGVTSEDVTATCRDGILEVRMPAGGVAQPQSVPIEVRTDT